MEANRTVPRSITYLEGEHDSRDVSFAELYERALGILYHLQHLGARRGDKLILFLANNEQFIDAFWAAVLGGIVPVPVALGISDEHRHKLLRIARKLGKPFLYTEKRSLERIGAFAAQVGEQALFSELRGRTFLVDELDDISRAGSVQKVAADDIAFIQFSSGSTSEPKGVVLTHGNILANARGSTEVAGFNEDDVSLSWMPLTHDMGLIGFHIFMFANRVHTHLMPTELFVRRPLLWLTVASRVRASILCSPNFGYRHYLKVLGERTPESLDLSAVRLIFNGAEPISVELCDEFLGAAGTLRPEAHRHVPGVRPGRSLAGGELPGRGRPTAHAGAQPPPAERRHTGGAGCRRRQGRGGAGVRGQRDPLLPRAHRRCGGPRAAARAHRPHPDQRRQRHARLLRGPRRQRRGVQRRWLAAHRGPGADARRASCTSPGAPRRSSSSTARTTTRTTWRRSRSAPRAWSWARWSPPACAAPARRPRN